MVSLGSGSHRNAREREGPPIEPDKTSDRKICPHLSRPKLHLRIDSPAVVAAKTNSNKYLLYDELCIVGGAGPKLSPYVLYLQAHMIVDGAVGIMQIDPFEGC